MRLTNVPKISVVTPSFNQAPYLEACLSSVLNQKYPNLEYIVIDGGSTDGSVEIIQAHQSSLSYWISEPDSGHADALNKGFSRCSGDILCWLNSDDMQTPWTLSTVADIFMEFEDVEWIQGWNGFWTKGGVMVHPMRNPKNIYSYLTWNYHWIQQESVFWSRNLWRKAGSQINPDYKLMVDVELWSRFFLYADLYHVDALLGGWRNTGENRALMNKEECHIEALKAIATMEDRIDRKTLRCAKTFRLLSLLRNNTLTRMLCLANLLISFPSVKNLINAAGYREIRWNDEVHQWQRMRSPFHS
ncbi:glycosyltransferase family 2 protein [Synechococcus sp. CCY 9618]|uniref:glycosyltransferase family 2 protein n=1 Tax=Synechococcus sp. CCY 9618 TaxID=2815602 RepID=UPI001C211BE6|nr:glycosyltransferase family 2 protein [Synechococcus sp. CCY 9618]